MIKKLVTITIIFNELISKINALHYETFDSKERWRQDGKERSELETRLKGFFDMHSYSKVENIQKRLDDLKFEFDKLLCRILYKNSYENYAKKKSQILEEAEAIKDIIEYCIESLDTMRPEILKLHPLSALKVNLLINFHKIRALYILSLAEIEYQTKYMVEEFSYFEEKHPSLVYE